jgi:hypothetical protein
LFSRKYFIVLFNICFELVALLIGAYL